MLRFRFEQPQPQRTSSIDGNLNSYIYSSENSGVSPAGKAIAIGMASNEGDGGRDAVSCVVTQGGVDGSTKDATPKEKQEQNASALASASETKDTSAAETKDASGASVITEQEVSFFYCVMAIADRLQHMHMR